MVIYVSQFIKQMLNTDNNFENPNNTALITRQREDSNIVNKLKETVTINLTYTFKCHKDVSKATCTQLADDVYKIMMETFFKTMETDNNSEPLIIVRGQVEACHLENGSL